MHKQYSIVIISTGSRNCLATSKYFLLICFEGHYRCLRCSGLHFVHFQKRNYNFHIMEIWLEFCLLTYISNVFRAVVSTWKQPLYGSHHCYVRFHAHSPVKVPLWYNEYFVLTGIWEFSEAGNLMSWN